MIDKLRKLFSVFIVYRSNFHMLHWKFKGDEFDTMHQVLLKLAEGTLEDADYIAEVLIRLGDNPANYPETLEILRTSDHKFIMVGSGEDYNRESTLELIDNLLKDILYAIEEALYDDDMQNEHSNVGMRSSLEAIYDKYDKELRYLNKRRK